MVLLPLLALLTTQGSPLDALEVRAKALPGSQTKEGILARVKFNQDVITLVGSNRLVKAEEFRRAGNLIQDVAFNFDLARVRYELCLAAAAQGDEPSRQEIAFRWDWLQASLGRPMRIGKIKVPDVNRPNSQFSSSQAPVAVSKVMLDPNTARQRAKGQSPNAELRKIVEEDQKARENFANLTSDDFLKLAEQDQKRWDRVMEIVSAGELSTPEDYSAAALVLQHGHNYASYSLAHELAVCAVLLGGDDPWLCAATYDRMLGSCGHRQRFATQYGAEGLRRVDAEGICDNERKALGAPTLKQALQRKLL